MPFRRPSRRCCQALLLALLVHALPVLSFFFTTPVPTLPVPLAVELWPASSEAGVGESVRPETVLSTLANSPRVGAPSVAATRRATGKLEARAALPEHKAERLLTKTDVVDDGGGASGFPEGHGHESRGEKANEKDVLVGTGALHSGQGELSFGAGSPVPARFDAAYLNNPSPEYPPVARRRGLEGTVLLSVAVCAEGRATQLEVRTTSGSAHLDRAAFDAVRRWRFVPARAGGQAVASRIVVPIVFRLEG